MKLRNRKVINSTDPCSNMQEEVSRRKRRAGDDEDPPSKRMRWSSFTEPTEHSDVSVEDSGIQSLKRKASEDGEAPRKKRRSSNSSSSSSSSAVSSISASNTSTSSVSVEQDPKAGPNQGEVIHDFSGASAEEENIFELSSSANSSRADFEDRYCQLTPIGAGGFGTVFNGVRKSDSLPVAIKHISIQDVKYEKVTCNRKLYNIIPEVALMLKAAGLPESDEQSRVVSLLDWYILDQELVIIMEKPVLSMDLQKYVQSRGGSLDEQEAKMILRQMVDAAVHMHDKGVFHRDIKLQNVLVELESGAPRVRIIDFGCSTFSLETTFESFSGTRAFVPPEWLDYKAYWSRPTTVWQLGALFYSLLRGHEPFTTTEFIHNHIRINRALSTDVKSLLHMCLDRDPMERISLEDLQLSPVLRTLHPLKAIDISKTFK